MASKLPRDPRDDEIERLRREIEELKAQSPASPIFAPNGDMNAAEAWQMLVEAVPGLFFVALDPECHDIACCQATRTLLNLAPGQNPSVSHPQKDKLPPYQIYRNGKPVPESLSPLQEAAQGKYIPDAEMEVVFNNGRRIFMHGSAMPIWGPDRKPVGAVAAYADVTAHRLAELEFQRSTGRLQAALRAAKAGTWELEGELCRVTLSPWLIENYGLPREPIMLDRFIEMAHPDDRLAFSQVLSETLTHRTPVGHELRMVTADGSVRWVYLRGEIRTDLDDMSPTIAGTLMDITEQKRVTEALAASERRFRRLFELPLVAVLFWNPAGRIIEANATACRILGFEPSHLSQGAINLHDLTPAECKPLRPSSFSKGHTRSVECEFQRKDGSRVHVLLSGAPLGPEEGGVLLFNDIEERVQQEKELEDLVARLDVERKRLSEMLARAPGAIAMFAGPEHVVEMVNEEMIKALGEVPKIGLPVREGFPPMSDNVFVDNLDQVFRTGESLVGHEQPTCLHLVDPPAFERYVDYVYEPVRDVDGTVTGVFMHAIDVTARAIARQKIERLNEELEERVRRRTAEHEAAVREMAEFTYSVSHDLRAPLRAIMATSRILVDEIGPDLNSEDRELLERQAYNAHRLGVLIDELLKHSRLSRRPLRPEVVNLSVIAEDIVRTIPREPGLPPIDVEIQPNLAVIADAGHVRLLLESLLHNAWKFSPNGGKVTVGREGQAYFIRDEGIGFDMKYVQKLFQPFERLVLDRDFPGTGIGLANVRRIAELHGGTVWAEGELGKGSTFYFTLTP